MEATKAGTRSRGKIKAPTQFETTAKQGWVPVAKLFSDPAYQRPVDTDRVRAMAVNFNPDAIGSILVSKRIDGSFAVFDGFHRVSLFRLFGWDDQKIPATIYENLSPEQEAHLFAKVNKERTKPKPLAMFKADVASGDPKAIELANIMTNLGITFDSYHAVKGGIRAIDTIRRVHNICGLTTVRRTLTVLSSAWANDADALNGEVFKGVALFLHHYGAKVDLSNLTGKLREHEPLNIRTRAKSLNDIMPEWQSASCLASVVTNLYNHRLRKENRLPAWEGHAFPRASTPSGRK